MDNDTFNLELQNEIQREIDHNFDSVRDLIDLISSQKQRIQELENEIASKDAINRCIFNENAEYSNKALTILLNIIWPLSKNADFLKEIFKNAEFITLLFDTVQSATSQQVLFPALGILANLNANSAFLQELGHKSGEIIINKYHQELIFETINPLIIHLIYNISFNQSIYSDLCLKRNFVDLLENLSRQMRTIALQNEDPLCVVLQRAAESYAKNQSLNDTAVHSLGYKLLNICKTIHNGDLYLIILKIINHE